MTKLLKNNKGFTLVEVIVVAVIVLILAAVAIPLYNGYIEDSRRAALENACGAIASAAGAAIQSDGGISTNSPVSGDATSPANVIVMTTSTGAGTQVLVPKGMTATWNATTVTMTYNNATVAAKIPAVSMQYTTP
ncbi:MAG: prepilin-type N-terminal cleavage/methylation domain-containing protein [Chitinispirillales bacterium]|jgi:prepilin-type N-terminal cleavage/methylation domain-containing protein|nr:prepilin-type N-terminal cleavage/methylation domain-containing protein [Chitinispirillales bacterium]